MRLRQWKSWMFGAGMMVAAVALAGISKAQDPTSVAGMPASDRPASSTNQSSPGVARSTTSGFGAEAAMNGSAGNDVQAEKDTIFLHDAAEGGIAEVQLGQLAAQKASTDDVKKMAQQLSDDHKALNVTMNSVADELGVQQPTRMNKMDQAEYDKLNGLSGMDFDKEYLAYMSKDHHKDLHEFRLEIQMTQEQSLKEAAISGIKVIAKHTKMVDTLAKADGVPVAARPTK